MNDAMRSLNRRQVLGGGVLFGASLLLSGCNKGRKRFVPLSEAEKDGPPHLDLPRGPRTYSRGSPSTPGPAGVIPRREWTNAGPVLSLINPMNGINRITIHHSAIISSTVRSKADAARMMDNLRRGHTGQGWADIGYHYVIDPQGRIWEGRPIQYQGAHVKENNEHNLGVMCMGNFDVERPTPEMLQSLDMFVADRMRFYNVSVSRVYTHQEIKATACPGRNLQGYMVATRSGNGRLARA
jgi:hypothetical protein